jgi:autotransporter-associated beta strand protein
MKANLPLFFAVVSSALTAASSSHAATWTGATNASWATASNWTGTAPNNVTPQAILYDATSTQNPAQTLDGSYTITGITVGDPVGIFIQIDLGTGTNVLALGAGGIDMSAAADDLILNVFLDVAVNQSWSVGVGRQLTLAGGINDTAAVNIAFNGGGTYSFIGSTTANFNLGGTVTFGSGAIWQMGTAASQATGTWFGSDGTAGTGSQITFAGDNTIRSNTLTQRFVNNNLVFQGDMNIYSMSLFGAINLNGGTRTLTTDSLNNTTLSGVISNGSLTKAGPFSTLVLSGANTYAGATQVDAGTLLVNGTNSGNGAVTVNNTGTLGGSGTIAGAVTVNEGGTLAPGASVGTLTTGAATLKDGARIGWEIADWNGPAGTSYDTLNTANLTVDIVAASPVTVVVTPASLVNFSETNKTFTLATTTGVFGYDPGEIIVDASAFTGTGTWAVQVTGNNLELVYTADGDPYEAWETLQDIAGSGAAADPDDDDIDNGIEFVIGGDPSGPNSASQALLPTTSLDPTHLRFFFRRTDASAGYDPFVEYSTTLNDWTVAEGGVDGVVIAEEDDFFDTDIDRVTVILPRELAVGGKLFARLQVVIP